MLDDLRRVQSSEAVEGNGFVYHPRYLRRRGFRHLFQRTDTEKVVVAYFHERLTLLKVHDQFTHAPSLHTKRETPHTQKRETLGLCHRRSPLRTSHIQLVVVAEAHDLAFGYPIDAGCEPIRPRGNLTKTRSIILSCTDRVDSWRVAVHRSL